LDIDPRVDVFTTNYDLIVEEAIEQTGLAIETGRTRSVTPRLSVDLWDTTENIASPRKTGIFTKLHGSIDWIWGEDGEIFVGTPRFTGSHKQHAIIYPGLKGPPRAAPFTAFHDYLKLSSEAATAAIFIGFAFRDEYINEIVRDRLRPGMPIVVIGLGEQPQDIPFRKGQYNYIADGFTQHTAHQALEWIEKALRQ
jgi:hypothetical protein